MMGRSRFESLSDVLEAPRDTMRRSRLYLPWSLLAVFLSAHRVRTFRSRACISAAITRPVVMWVMDPTLLGALKRVNILQKTDSCYSSILRSHPLAIVSGEISTIKTLSGVNRC
uniref:Uncharacterized protein n=1 Tax=Timema genevievae TaxID=629358 RepID=A0A7R9PH99_TIMGE|nr:unnamed protein product [Timema genevievae]